MSVREDKAVEKVRAELIVWPKAAVWLGRSVPREDAHKFVAFEIVCVASNRV